MELIDKYNKLNNSFKKNYIFHIGAEAGFYSEFNNMVYAILYCLKYKYKFILYSREANFRINKGWEDFFEPFCHTTDTILLNRLNTRTTAPSLNRKQKIQYKLFKLFYPNTLLTYQLWPYFFCPAFEKETFVIPELGINGSLRDAARIIVNMIYRPNRILKTDVQNTLDNLQLPNEYISINVRRGDKNTEFDYVSIETFINAIKEKSKCKNLFIFTDDYSVIEELNVINTIEQYKLYYLVNKDDRGYVHKNFGKLKITEKYSNLLKMFTSVEIMSNAQISFGSFTNNPGFFLGMRMSEDKFVSLQKSIWYQFEMSDVVNVMSKEMRNFLESVDAKL